MYNTIRNLSPEGDGAAAVNAHIGAHLRMRREYMNLTQAQVAAQMGVTQGTYQKIEAGTSALTVARLAQVCFALVGARGDDPPRSPPSWRRDASGECGPSARRARDLSGLTEVEWLSDEVFTHVHRLCEALNPGVL